MNFSLLNPSTSFPPDTLRQPQLDRGNTAHSPSRVAIPTVNTMNTIVFDDDDLFTFFVNYSELTFDGEVKSYILQ